MIRRLTYLGSFAALAALGEALVAPPAVLWVRSQGLSSPAIARDVPYGALLLACAVLLALITLALASAIASSRKPRLRLHLALLLAAAASLALRSASGNPGPPPDPRPQLLDALRVAGDELDRGYAGFYAPDAGQLGSALAQARQPPFRRAGRTIPLRARILSGRDGPQMAPLPGDPPGTVYVAISSDRQSAWVTALALERVLTLPAGTPAVVVARGGTHSPPGSDPHLPAYRAR
ncbi:MAG TPA: hypothetical protein VFA79_20655 [Myxococcales bacterium]|nr:hypothetical protein [Myxococcales bacterium]